MVYNMTQQTLQNDFFRKVLQTTKHTQLVVMSLKPLEDIGAEMHDSVDQFIRIEKGTGKLILDGVEFKLKDDSAFIIPAGSHHNVINISETEKMKLYTLYSPPNHADGKIDKTKPIED